MAPRPTVKKVERWADQVAPMAWRPAADGGPARIYYHRTGQGVVAEGYSCLPDRTDERLETGSLAYPAGTHQSIEDVSADGRLALVTVERHGHPPKPDGYPGAAPGVGTYNDLWLLELATGRTWKLVDTAVPGKPEAVTSLIWPRFDSTGGRVAWAELREAHWYDLGLWNLYVADLRFTDGVPALSNRRTYKGAGFLEAYGFIDGDSAVLATASLNGLAGLNPQIVRLPVTASAIGAPTRLSPSRWPDDVIWPYAAYCEFAYDMPAYPDLLMFGTTWKGINRSIEFWTMPRAGGAATRLTYLSDPGHPTYQGDPQVMLGGIAWDPSNPKRFVAGYQRNYDGDARAVMIELT